MDDEVPAKRKKKSDIALQGNSLNPNIADDLIQEVDKIEMLNKNYMNLDEVELTELLQQTYPQNRAFIDKTPTIAEVQKSWPSLLHGKVILWNYKKLVGHNIDQLEKAINLKLERLTEFALHKKLIKKSSTDTNEQHLDLFRYLTKHFKENFEHILKIVPVISSGINENSFSVLNFVLFQNRSHCKDAVLTSSPCILFAESNNCEY